MSRDLMEASYRDLLEKRDKCRPSKITSDDIPRIVAATQTILRRHSITGTLCPACSSDRCRVVQLDKVGYIVAVECDNCADGRRISAVCHRSHCHFEPITDVTKLRPGDHICWHRPYLVWHHAIVDDKTRDEADAQLAYIEYDLSKDGPYVEVLRTVEHYTCCSIMSGTLYRVTYADCYTNDFCLLRARKLIGDRRYDIFDRNCEHSVRWCKTGREDSLQVDICLSSIGKISLVMVARLVMLLILWLIQMSQDDEDDDIRVPDTRSDRIVNIVYIAFIAIVFLVYSVHQSCTRLKPVDVRRQCEVDDDDTDACAVEHRRRDCADAMRCTVHGPSCIQTLLNVCVLGPSLMFWLPCSFVDAVFRRCRPTSPCVRGVVCRRPAVYAVALVVRIMVRELIAAAGPLVVVWHEDNVLTSLHIDSVGQSAALIAVIIVVAGLIAYLVGALLGVWVELLLIACCTCCCCNRPSRDPHQVDVEHSVSLMTSDCKQTNIDDVV